MSLPTIRYESERRPSVDEAAELYRASTLAERRPVDDRERFARMLTEASFIVTAWEGPLLVGLARGLSDFVYVTYLADLAVRVSHQRSGIGRELIRRTQRLSSPEATLLLRAAPAAAEYYRHIGFTAVPNAWVLQGGESLK